MRGRFFLDTNIFVYSFDQASPAKVKRASQLIRQALGTGRGVVSYQIVQEFFNVALRRFEKPMAIADAQQYLTMVFRPMLAVHSSHSLYAKALDIASRYRFGWYDSLVVAAASAAECSILFSEDLQDGFELGDLRIENPFRTR
jgi:predicted nucleic acid-binding protein